MQEFILKNKNYRIRYHELPGEGTPILFIHGIGCAGSFDYTEVATQKELLGNKRILIDLLGSGFSDKPKDFSYNIEDHAKYIYDFICHIELEKFILFGHSVGGAIALSLANMCKERVVKIILSEANLDSGGGFFTREIVKRSFENFKKEGFQNMIKKSNNSSNEMWASTLSVCSPKAIYYTAKSVIEGVESSWREILYSLNCPKTYIFGENSLPDPDLEILKQQGINIEIVKNAGHSMAWENPKGLAVAIKNGSI